jgi:peroxiredoxin
MRPPFVAAFEIADAVSAIIRKYGLLNETVYPKSRTYGIPHPGTFVVDRKGVVRSRFFEDAYQERYTAATILSTLSAGCMRSPGCEGDGHVWRGRSREQR